MPLPWLIALGLPLLAVCEQKVQTPVFQTESSLALVRFHVERKHSYAGDLKPGDIILLEDWQPRGFTGWAVTLMGA
jgi:hypothetical protein